MMGDFASDVVSLHSRASAGCRLSADHCRHGLRAGCRDSSTHAADVSGHVCLLGREDSLAALETAGVES